MSSTDQGCRHLILSELAGDPRTLSRVMRSSKRLFDLASPILYGALWDPTYSQIEAFWSPIKSRRLLFLIMVCSGYIGRDGKSPLGNFQTKPPWKMTKEPYVNYYNLLQRIGNGAWEDSPWKRQSDGKSIEVEEVAILEYTFYTHHAPVIHHIVLPVSSSRNLLPFVSKFKSLSTLSLDSRDDKPFGYPELRVALDFIKAHKKVFPGQLKQVTVPPAGFAAVNEELEPEEWSFPYSATEAIRFPPWYHGFKGIKKFQCLYSSNVRDLDKAGPFLQKLRLAESIHFDGTHTSADTWTNLLSWAVKELKQPGMQPTDLVPVTYLTMHAMPYSTIRDGIDGFRHSLQHLDYRGEGRITVSWNWPLSRLISIKLDNCRLDYSVLSHCPILKSLELTEAREYSGSTRNTLWSLPRTLETLALDGEPYRELDYGSLAHMVHLRDVTFKHFGALPASCIKRLDSLETSHWKLPKLVELTQTAGAANHWKLRLMAAAPNLKRMTLVKQMYPPDTTCNYFQNYPLHLTAHQSKIEIMDLFATTGNVEACRYLLNIVIKPFKDSKGKEHINFPKLRALSINGATMPYPEMGKLLVAVMKRPNMEHLQVGAIDARFGNEKMDLIAPSRMREPLFPSRYRRTTLELPDFCVLVAITAREVVYKLRKEEEE